MNNLFMKQVSGFVCIFSATILFFSCQDDVELGSSKKYRPLRIEETDYKRELFFNGVEQVIKIVSESYMPDRDVISTEQRFEYDSEGRIVKSIFDDGRHYDYTWEDGHIVRTEEFEKGVHAKRFIFSYQSNGLVKEMVSYTYEGSEPKVAGKIVYAFDVNKNISSVKEFSFTDSGFLLGSIYEYDRYDNFSSADSRFDFHSLNPSLHFHRNNPGRMVSKNKNGLEFCIEDYVYEYNTSGYPVKRETNVTFLHTGSTGSYETRYFFQEI
jgi:hypothetical protein